MKRHGEWRQRSIVATAAPRIAESVWLEPAAIAP
jgi:hypothetical protein